MDSGVGRNEEDTYGEYEELEEKLELSENLQSEVVALKAGLDKVKGLNVQFGIPEQNAQK